ncbi:nitrate- and nitrite sensing domain-containing protein [Streptomyces sp. NPDC046909]|uniref:sensor histidine kinase n=1 Tax=Streptomyces sp. NPDC046909 TaxID=3155617 RepID=UPI0033D60972
MSAIRAALSWRTIRGRTAVILAVPTCLLLALVGSAVAKQLQVYQDARDTRSRIDVALRIQALVDSLQYERTFTSALLSGGDSFREKVTDGRGKVDSFRVELRDEPAVTDTLGALSRLASVRSQVDSGTADQKKTNAFYTDAIGALNSANPAESMNGLGDRQLRDDLAALGALAEAKEAGSQAGSLLSGVLVAGKFSGTNYVDFMEGRATRISAIDRFFRIASPAQREAVQKILGGMSGRLDSVEAKAVAAYDGRRLDAPVSEYLGDLSRLDSTVYKAQQRVDADALARAETLSDQATLALLGYLGIMLLVVAVLAAAAVLANRSITRPLDALAGEADDVARHRLPRTVALIQAGQLVPSEEIPPSADGAPEEISRVVTALRNVERTALDLATEQTVLRRNSAESLANLGRRNQGLVRRQLALITALERQELDPEALAELFELDHLATRMRRNAESLLVLVDERSPQVRSATASSLEVVQSAIGEVEQYRRVAIAAIEPRRISGRAVSELSHLLAELVENALTYSPPDQTVDIHGWAEGEEFNLAVVDHGIGMSPEDLARANARIAGEEVFLVAPTRFLGHYVVGRLARRLGVEVMLSHSPAGGVSALVTLPARILVPEEAPPPDPHRQISSVLNSFRAGVARAEAG